jgi:hypothetical protein
MGKAKIVLSLQEMDMVIKDVFGSLVEGDDGPENPPMLCREWYLDATYTLFDMSTTLLLILKSHICLTVMIEEVELQLCSGWGWTGLPYCITDS